MQPQVLTFFHADSNTFTYVVADASTGAAAVIDPALDYVADTGVIETHTAQAILAGHRATRMAAAVGCWKPMRMPITCLLRNG